MKTTYTPAEICQIVGISKSTLFRWEEEQAFPRVPRDRESQDQRLYTQEHINYINRRLLNKQYKHAADRGDIKALDEIHEEMSIRKFIAGDTIGLNELSNYDQLKPRTISTLLQIASERFTPGEETFCKIIELVQEKACKRSGG
jgi:DNA-binding transcriptional MerR regulator